MRNGNLAEALRGRTLVGDAGLGARLFSDTEPRPVLEVWNREAPERVQSLHELDLRAGAELLVTNSFRSDAASLSEFELAEESFEFARLAAEIARTALASNGRENECYVLGSLGPGPGLREEEASSADHLQAAEGLIAGGVDGLLVETMRHPKRAVAVLEAAHRARESSALEAVPVLLSFTPDAEGRLLGGTRIEDVISAIDGRVDAVGLNCVPLQPAGLSKILERLEPLGLPLFLAPNPASGARGTLSFAEDLASLSARHNLALVRGCCGSTAEHVAALHSRLRC